MQFTIRLLQIIGKFSFLLQWTATVTSRSRFAASLNEPLVIQSHNVVGYVTDGLCSNPVDDSIAEKEIQPSVDLLLLSVLSLPKAQLS